MLQQLNSLHCIKPERLKGPLPFFDLQPETPACGCIKHTPGASHSFCLPFQHASYGIGFCSLVTRTWPSSNLSDQAFRRFKWEILYSWVWRFASSANHSLRQTSGQYDAATVVFCKCFQREAVSIRTWLQVILCESSWNLWKDEMDQKSYSSFFSQRTKLSLLLYSTRFDPILLTHLHGHKIRELYM